MAMAEGVACGEGRVVPADSMPTPGDGCGHGTRPEARRAGQRLAGGRKPPDSVDPETEPRRGERWAGIARPLLSPRWGSGIHSRALQALTGPATLLSALRASNATAALIAAALCVAILPGCSDERQQDKTVVRLYAGAGLRRAVEALATAFEKETGISISPDYAGSGVLISRARLDAEADLFMPGDVWYVDRLNELAGLIESKTAVAFFVPVIIVRKGNPKNIRTPEDFFRKDVAVALGQAKACQVGRASTKILQKHGLDRAALGAKESLTVNELGVWVKMGDIDAAIVWDAIAANLAESVETIEIPKDKNVISRVVVGLMTTSRNKGAARKFVDFMTGPKGRAILQAHEYQTLDPSASSGPGGSAG